MLVRLANLFDNSYLCIYDPLYSILVEVAKPISMLRGEVPWTQLCYTHITIAYETLLPYSKLRDCQCQLGLCTSELAALKTLIFLIRDICTQRNLQ